MIHIYCDGSYTRKNGNGGVGVYSKELNIQYYEGFTHTTNNRMEFIAILMALKLSLDHKEKLINIYSDSEYCVKTINLWYEQSPWKERKNMDLILKIFELKKQFLSIAFVWVKGHNGVEGNEIADHLACSGSSKTEGLIQEKHFQI